MSGIRVNFSNEEAEAGSFEELPVGKYKVRIDECEMRESKSEKNPGKPMYNFTFIVLDEGPYEGRKAFTNATLWSGALYTISAILKALGEDINAGDYEIPDVDFFLDKELVIKIARGKDSKEKNDDGTPKYAARNEVKGFFAPKDPAGAKAEAGSLLP
jgi:hypothetical protein